MDTRVPFLSLLSPQPALINCRYRLLEPLGAGGMGVVYRAYDRLTGQVVALKQVLAAAHDWHFASRPASGDSHQLRLSLAQEFKFLAALRHPNIVSVFDYGFDAEQRPYFTMELLEDAQSLRTAGQHQPLLTQIDLLGQTFQALIYLHRHDILHHDLKPENVLVSQGRVRVLDFGLSVTYNQPQPTHSLGTLLYLSPEVLRGAAYTVAADLYAMGVMAYELFIGRHPFAIHDLDQFLAELLYTPPDLSSLAPPLAQVIGKLLAKEPIQRYQTAEDAAAALCLALGQPPPAESGVIRESFLQAAKFVGRQAELETLTTALAATHQRQGSAWLLGGESGVGKSRLLDELRTQALVGGVQVLSGQAVEDGGLPYQLWREPLRRLLLRTTLSDLEARILTTLVPDLADLLERPLPAVAELDEQAAYQRLKLLIVELCQRQTEPTLLLLEDLQWVGESLEPLQILLRLLPQLPWLVVISYRDDERHELPAELPSAQVMKLQRLGATAIAELSAAMLGHAGRQAPIVALIQRESEGNTFFAVEVVRALAEEAGQLSAIGRTPLPNALFAGGMQQVLRRRFARVPVWAQATLKLAAVAGRQLDRPLLRAASDALDWEAWLTACANAAVLEVADGQWRFAHDKLRATLLADLTDAERTWLHRQVAQALETIYPNNIAYAETLADHWEQAVAPAKALPYLLQAAEHYIRITANYASAETLIARGLQYVDSNHQAALLRLAGEAKRYQDSYAEAITYYTASLQLNAHNLAERAASYNGLSSALQRQGRYAEAAAYAQQAQAAARDANDTLNLALGLFNAGAVADLQAEYSSAKRYYTESLQLWRALGNLWGQSKTLSSLGIIASKEGQRSVARAHFEESLQIDRATGNRTGVAMDLLNLGIVSEEMGEYALARAYYRESLEAAEAIQDRQWIALIQYNLGCSYINEGEYATALPYFETSLPLFAEIGDQSRVALCYANLGFVAYAQHAYIQARDDLTKSIQILRELGEREMVAIYQAERVSVLLRLDDLSAAWVSLVEALQLAQAVAMPAPQARALLAAADFAYARGEHAMAANWLGVLSADGMLDGRAQSLLQTLAKEVTRIVGREQSSAILPAGETGIVAMFVQEALEILTHSSMATGVSPQVETGT